MMIYHLRKGFYSLGTILNMCNLVAFFFQRKVKMPESLKSKPFRFTVGQFRCMILTDGETILPVSEVSDIFKDERVRAAFRALTAPLPMSMNILLVETDDRRILVDSGLAGLEPDKSGFLSEALRSEGIALESITDVVLSHFHLDHLAGLLDSEGKATYPNARLIVPKHEYDSWMDEKFLAELDEFRSTRLKQTFAAYPNIKQHDSTAEIVAGICYVPALGHTWGHCAVHIESQGQSLLHLVDTVHLTIQLNALDALPSFDIQPDIAVETRKRLVSQAEAANQLVMTYHFPFPGVGYFRNQNGVREWVPYAGA
jgi:glyoxylase-like metal-dependent hydrolase (beta-lactamase superfamily II)